MKYPLQPNLSVNRTARKLRLRVLSALRAPAARLPQTLGQGEMSDES